MRKALQAASPFPTVEGRHRVFVAEAFALGGRGAGSSASRPRGAGGSVGGTDLPVPHWRGCGGGRRGEGKGSAAAKAAAVTQRGRLLKFGQRYVPRGFCPR